MQLSLDALLVCDELNIVLNLDGLDTLLLQLVQVLLVRHELVVLLGNRAGLVNKSAAAENERVLRCGVFDNLFDVLVIDSLFLLLRLYLIPILFLGFGHLISFHFNLGRCLLGRLQFNCLIKLLLAILLIILLSHRLIFDNIRLHCLGGNFDDELFFLPL